MGKKVSKDSRTASRLLKAARDGQKDLFGFLSLGARQSSAREGSVCFWLLESLA